VSLTDRTRSSLRHLRRRLSPQRTVWRRALPTEVAYWTRWIETRGEGYPDDFRRRFDPDQPLQEPLLLDVIERLPPGEVSILDVGAGPATWLGKTHPLRRLDITAVDPLGDEYRRLLARAGLEPPVRTRAVAGERLLEAFGPGAFDIAYARNALDHSADPAAIVEAMLATVRDGGFVVLRHFENEARSMRYEELHQWNFAIDGGALVVWNPRRRVDLTARLAGRARVEAAYDGGSAHARWVTAVIERRPTGTAP
jgi:SAM-dependent methyltransferase